MARYYFGDERRAVGRFVRFAGPAATPTEIVGVAGDYARGTPRGGKQTEFATYFPYRDTEALNKGAQTRLRVMLVVIRSEGDPTTVASAARSTLREIDPDLPVVRINTAEQHVDDVLSQDWLVAVLSTTLSGVALVIACLGLFGIVSYRVLSLATRVVAPVWRRRRRSCDADECLDTPDGGGWCRCADSGQTRRVRGSADRAAVRINPPRGRPRHSSHTIPRWPIHPSQLLSNPDRTCSIRRRTAICRRCRIARCPNRCRSARSLVRA